MVESLFKSLEANLKSTFKLSIFRKGQIRRKIKNVLKTLATLYNEDDEYSAQLKQTTNSGRKGSVAANIPQINMNAGAETHENREETISRELQFAKLNKLKKDLVMIKEAFSEAHKYLYNEHPLFIVLDDFYFINIENQPYLADILHVLTKGLRVYKKFASIKHRSKFYVKDNNTYQGIELGHDAIEIDLDYSLEDMDELQQFFSQLLIEIFNEAKVSLTERDIFGGAGFKQLCIASGGVTRDFLLLLSKCINDLIVEPDMKIGKEMVNAQASAYMVNKLQSLSDDVKAESEKLENLLNNIKRKVLTEKRTNCFLVSKGELEKFPEIKNAIRDLFDMRLIHLLDQNTSSAPADGKSYEAYILDVGLYDFTRLRNFDQVEPGNKDDRSRKDDMRSSPKIKLDEVFAIIE